MSQISDRFQFHKHISWLHELIVMSAGIHYDVYSLIVLTFPFGARCRLDELGFSRINSNLNPTLSCRNLLLRNDNGRNLKAGVNWA